MIDILGTTRSSSVDLYCLNRWAFHEIKTLHLKLRATNAKIEEGELKHHKDRQKVNDKRVTQDIEDYATWTMGEISMMLDILKKNGEAVEL